MRTNNKTTTTKTIAHDRISRVNLSHGCSNIPARMAGKKASTKEVDVDEAWKESVQAHHEDKMSLDAGKSKGVYRNRMKIAASIVGIIFLSGVALAAIHNGWLGYRGYRR